MVSRMRFILAQILAHGRARLGLMRRLIILLQPIRPFSVNSLGLFDSLQIADFRIEVQKNISTLAAGFSNPRHFGQKDYDYAAIKYDSSGQEQWVAR